MTKNKNKNKNKNKYKNKIKKVITIDEPIWYSSKVVSSFSKNTNGKLYPLTQKKLDHPIWLIRQINMYIPNEIIRYICLLCIISNEKKWKKDHKRNSFNIFSKISINNSLLVEPMKGFSGEEIWIGMPRPQHETVGEPPCNCYWCNGTLQDDNYNYSYSFSTTCSKSIKYLCGATPAPTANMPEQENINFVELSNAAINTFQLDYLLMNRRYHHFNKPTNYFAFSDKCRCFMCDSVKSALVHSNKFKKEFKKYKNIYKGLYYSWVNNLWSNWMPRNNELYFHFPYGRGPYGSYGIINKRLCGSLRIGVPDEERTFFR